MSVLLVLVVASCSAIAVGRVGTILLNQDDQ